MTAPGVPDPGTRPVPNPGSKVQLPTAGLGKAFEKGANPTRVDRALNNAAGGVMQLDDVAAAAHAWISDRHNWVRVMWFAGGVICVAVGVAMLAQRPATEVASKVVPAGKAVSAVKKVAS